jgi:hypothetical protein
MENQAKETTWGVGATLKIPLGSGKPTWAISVDINNDGNSARGSVIGGGGKPPSYILTYWGKRNWRRREASERQY